jgi:hypothetical protein
MIKVFVHIAKLIVAIAVSLCLFSCGLERVDGTGNVITQPRNAGSGFTKIDAAGDIEVYIVQGDKTSISVEADGNLQEHIKTEVSGSTLTIKTDVNIGNSDAKKVTVTLPKVDAVESGAGCLVKSTTVLKSDDLKITASSGSNLEVVIDAAKSTVEASKGSKIKVSGTTAKMQINSSSGSNIDAKGLTAANVDADASSGGNMVVNAVEKLSAKASSGSAVNFVKTPNKLDKKESSGGTVSQD